MIGQPFIIANKVFLASLGLISTIQSEASDKFDELVKDGEKARDKYQASFRKFQKGLGS
jgi:polyhydroxyalkanoate synthesis regulator phasin